MERGVKLLLISCLLIGCDSSRPDPAPEDRTEQNGIRPNSNLTPLQYEIIKNAVATHLRAQNEPCDETYFMLDHGECEEVEQFHVFACDQDFLVVFDLSQDKVISVNRLDESRPDGP